MKSIVVPAFFIFAITALADTIEVPGDHPTIQAAIDQAVAGDTVLVMAGTYEESISFKGKAITVMSQDGPESTIIDGKGLATVVEFVSSETRDSVLDGFTISNGLGQYGGGGIRCVDSSPVIRNNIIVHCTITTPTMRGGGVSCKGGAPEVRGNLVAHCFAMRGAGIHFETDGGTVEHNRIWRNGRQGGGYGGGLLVAGDKAQTIRENLIESNGAVNGGGLWLEDAIALVEGNTIENNFAKAGGGIYCEGGSPTCRANRITGNYSEYKYLGGAGICCMKTAAIIADNLIAHNETNASIGVGGGGISCWSGSNVLIVNNLVLSNAASLGGAIYCYDSAPLIVNNTLAGNRAYDAGGGLCCEKGCHPVIHNSIVWGNKSVQADAIFLYMGSSGPCSLFVSHSDIEGGQSEIYVGPQCTLNWGAGMIDGDPLFVDPAAGDYHLIHPSPCRDSGDGSAPGLPDLDFEGDPRVALGGVDMGADEFHTHLYCTGETVPGGHVRIKITDVPGLNHVYLWAGSYVSGPVPTPYGEWYLAPPILATFELGPVPTEGVHVLPIRIPSSCPGVAVPLQALAQDTLTNPCIVDIDQ